MVNDIPLDTFSYGGETTGLLRNRNRNNTKRLFVNRKEFVIVFLTFSILVSLFVVSIVDFWTDNKFNSYQSFQPSIVNKGRLIWKNGEYFVKCAPIVLCNSNDKYRTSNGTCNNLNNPIWGSSYTPFIRLVDAYYSDDTSKLRLSLNGTLLPSAREIQVQLFLNKQINISDKNNQLLMQWGQFVAHDVSVLAIDDNEGDCCLYNEQSWIPRACEATIQISDDDPVYSNYNKTCMQFSRAMTSDNYSCPLQISTFIDNVSHYIDGSQIYGSDDYVVSTLRSFTDGTLKSVIEGGEEFCPFLSMESYNNNTYVFKPGDSHANLNLGGALFHSMFLRFHNFIAFKLKSANTMWSDETLYQESRKIVGAIIQHITYTQFLPIILGKKYTSDEVLTGNINYDPTVNPSTSQEFSTGAFRVLHNIIPTHYRFVDSNYSTTQIVNVTDWMENSNLLQQDSNFDDLLRGLLYTGGRLSQPSYNFLVSNFMFHSNNSVGVDLLSYDIQRGRDTGLPPYNKMREICGLPVAKSFDDLIDVIPSDDIFKLENLYTSVNDIDFLVGALLESPEDDALVGNTSRCIIGDFFYRARVGDRFFYDNGKHFTEDQLQVLKSINLNHIICASSSINYLQKNIFLKVENGWYSSMKWTCNEKYQIDFTPWEEEIDHSYD